MNKKSIFSALAFMCLTVLGLVGCKQEEFNTDQLDESKVTLVGVAPNPVARGGALRILGSNLQNVQQVEIPGVEPITEIEVIASGKVSEIRVIVPVDGPEVGPVSIIAGDTKLTTKTNLEYSEPIVFDGFSPASAMPGDVITVKGDYMNNIRQITFEGGTVVNEFESQSRYELKVKVPSTAITGKIILGDVDESNNPDGKVSNLFYSEKELEIGDPTVNSKSYGVIKAGSEVTVTGAYLDMIEAVRFGLVYAEFAVAEDGKSLTAALPDTSVDGELSLFSYAAKEFKAGTFETLVPSDLKIAAATRYKAGLDVKITGKDIDLVTSGSLAGTELSLAVSDESITFTIPAEAKDGAVTLTLANGKTVDTDAIELVKPVITAVSPLELYAGDENITVTGEDLDLVVSAALGGKAAEFNYDETAGTIEIITDATSVGGKVTLIAANKESVESSDEIRINYHALVVVKEMPSAEHIGAKVTLKGLNFMLVENIYVGEEKVKSYFSRTDEEVSFVMPWNKVGMYNIYFHLLNGDVEMLATPIEVLLEQDIQVVWEGNTEITWGDGGRVVVPASAFDGVPAGAKMRLYYTQKDQVWAQAQVNNGSWATLDFSADNIVNPIVPTDLYGWFSDGILDRCTEVTLTSDVLANIAANKGDFEGTTAGVIIQGSDLIFTKIDIVAEIPQEKTIFEGPVALTWGDDGRFGLATSYFENLPAGSKMIIYFTQTEAWGQAQINDGSWKDTGFNFPELGGAYLNTNTLNDKSANKIELTLTQEILDHMKEVVGDYWGVNNDYRGDGRVAIVIQGSDWIIDRIAVK